MARASAASKGHNWRLKVFTRALIQMEGLHIPRLEPVLFDLIIIYMNFHRLLRNVHSEPLDGFWNNMKSELNVEDNHEDGIRGLQRLQEVIDCWRYRNHSHKAFIHVIFNLKWRFWQPQYLYFYLWIIIFAVDCNFWTAGWILKR